MTDIHLSLVTSLYRAEKHLPQFVKHVVDVSRKIPHLNLEFIPVVNDATPGERALIDDLASRVNHVKPLYVERESLYASWNRGVQMASGQGIGFWNVDDVRTPDALVDGYRRIQNGCQLVYFSHTVLRPGAIMPYHRERVYPVVPFTRENHRAVMKCGPFFLFAPSLYEKVGPFDERFRIVGDWEWCIRALDHAEFCPSPVNAGFFYLHGGNLSSTGNPLQVAEENVLFILHGMWDHLKPADPDTMRKTSAKWSSSTLPAEIETLLWGEGAQARWEQWQRENRRQRRRRELEQAVRFIPKTVIDSFGLRPLLSSIGLVKRRKTSDE